MLKLEPLTEHELEFIRWHIWEPLRRNPDYIKEFKKLKDGYFFDLDGVKTFCEKWEIPYSVAPELESKSLLKPTKDELEPQENETIQQTKQRAVKEAKQRVRGIFYDLYKPLFDHAAFVDSRDWIVDDKYLKVWIDLRCPKNSIKSALKKELDEWRNQWVNFYGGEIQEEFKDHAVKEVDLFNNYLEIHINLEAPRSTRKNVSKGYIEPEIKKTIDDWHPYHKGKKKQQPRLSKSLELCFEIYDIIESKDKITQNLLAIKYNTDPSTIQKRYQKVWEMVHGVPYSERIKKRTNSVGLSNYVLIHKVEERLDVESVRHKKNRTASQQFKNMTSPSESTSFLSSNDCKFCNKVFCVKYSPRYKTNICYECGLDQRTGKTLRELLSKK